MNDAIFCARSISNVGLVDKAHANTGWSGLGPGLGFLALTMSSTTTPGLILQSHLEEQMCLIPITLQYQPLLYCCQSEHVYHQEMPAES
jgi:hypothetical protein